MAGMQSKELYNNIYHNLMNTKFLDETGLDREIIKNFLECSDLLSKVSTMEDDKDFSCMAALNLCDKLLHDIAGESFPDNALFYLYQYALNKSFPEAVTISLSDNLNSACEAYLQVLKAVSQFQMTSDDGTWQSRYPLLLLTPEEENSLEYPGEYRTFRQAFNDENVYEMMKLNQETSGHNTLDHICGVHHLAMFLARGLMNAGLPVDLGRVSGAAAGHDIGKFGCRASEYKRVPYLHYYYSDQWFKKHDITYIRHIALNHSTWDLELENLPLESLILIYSDFRVKNQVGQDGIPNMHIYSLSQSFDVVLNKLDNMDYAKEKRYKRVYGKLMDFENFMLHTGISINPGEVFQKRLPKKASNYSLMQSGQIVENIKYLSINHNINLMYEFRDEISLDSIIQSARSQTDWKNLREYIRMFEEYSTYLTQKQKLQTIRFLYEQLIHPEDDIRRHCAELIGSLIAIYDEDYRKEIPRDADIKNKGADSVELFDEYLHLFLCPGHKIIPNHRAWIGYSTSIMVSSLFLHCSPKLWAEYRRVLLKYFDRKVSNIKDSQLYLLKTAQSIPVSDNDDSLNILFDFILQMLKRRNSILRLSSFETACAILPYLEKSSPFRKGLKAIFEENRRRSEIPAENYLKFKCASLLDMDEELLNNLDHNCKLDRRKIPDIFLSNLKTATDWVTKKINVDILLEYALEKPEANGLHTALHFCNLLKVSAFETVRTHAGEAVLEIMPSLPLEQKNEVAVELLRALEIEGYHFTEYIPRYLGQLILYLQPVELDEIIDDLIEKIKQGNYQIKSLLLKTIGISISCYPMYRDLFPETEEKYSKRMVKMLGIILNGLGNYNTHVKQVAFSVLGKEIFGTSMLNLEQKNLIFTLVAKKLLTLITGENEDELLFLANSAGLNHIYRFISDYIYFKGDIKIDLPKKVAFFPGTFDPFTLSHKEIVRAIRDMGFEVYLAVDEFSWSKRTLPNLLRRKIISMSVADELGVYIYPENLPVNIANSSDLKSLKDNFPDSTVYIVAGSDVIINASSYKAKKGKDTIHTFPHIIIDRETHFSKGIRYEEIIKNIDGECIRVTLPEKYSGISSTQIRNYIDENRDISSLVDPLVQQYIYEYGFYQREPSDKILLTSPVSFEIEVVESLSSELLNELMPFFEKDREEIYKELIGWSKKESARLVLVRDMGQGGKLLGFTAFHWLRYSSIYNELKDASISEFLRENTVGRIVLIDGIFTDSSVKNRSMEQILLTEALSFCLAKDYEYAVYSCMVEGLIQPSLYDILKLQGFREFTSHEKEHTIFVVNMINPCVLNLDVDTIIKEPFRSNSRVHQTIVRSRHRLQEALTKLYPGELVLSFDINVQHESMIKKICTENGVSSNVMTPRKLGPAMCVPYGNILDKYIIPNTVTKVLHTEKLFDPGMRSFKIGAFPHYLNLEIQAKTIRSFNRPVILVDDLLHKGYRIRALEPIFKSEGINVQKIIVGILSGRGKELMDMQNRDVDCVYFIPRLRVWFNENLLYPFMGGDALWRGVYPERNLLPSINLILPYTSPTFIGHASNISVYNLSKVALENAIDILTTLENEYHILNEKKLTLALLGEVFITPRCPDHGMNMDYDLNLNPSTFLKNDLELLNRLGNSITRA